MNATRITINGTEDQRHALSEVTRSLATLGADFIETTDSRILALRGLTEYCSMQFKTAAAVDGFATFIKRRLNERRTAQQSVPCNETGDSDGCNLEATGRHSDDFKA